MYAPTLEKGSSDSKERAAYNVTPYWLYPLTWVISSICHTEIRIGEPVTYPLPLRDVFPAKVFGLFEKLAAAYWLFMSTNEGTLI